MYWIEYLMIDSSIQKRKTYDLLSYFIEPKERGRLIMSTIP